MALPLEKQLEITKTVKERFLYCFKNEPEASYTHNGLCNFFKSHEEVSWFASLGIQFPLFTRENAILLAEKYKFKKPTGAVYWWSSIHSSNYKTKKTDFKSRINFLDAMIKELEIQIQNQQV